MQFLTRLSLVATICFSSHMPMSASSATPAEPAPPAPPSTPGNARQLRSRRRRCRGSRRWRWVCRLASRVDWFQALGAIGDFASLLSLADLFSGSERRLSTGEIDWDTGKGATTDEAIHHWVNVHMVEIEDLMEPSLKTETLTHTHMEIENALSEAFEEFAEEHGEEIAQKLRDNKDTASVVSMAQVGNDGANRLASTKKTYYPSILVAGVFSSVGMLALFVAARKGFQRARSGPFSPHDDGLQRARLDDELQSTIE